MDDQHPTTVPDEPIEAYLKRRERELLQQTAALLGMLAPKERELEAVYKAMESLGMRIEGKYTRALARFLEPNDQPENPLVTHAAGINALAQMRADTPLALRVASLTIKQMILAALSDHFHDGAGPAELRDYMRTAYGREIDRNSIGPQLTRLKDDGLIEQPPSLADEGKWRLKKKDTSGQGAYHGVDIVTFNPGEAPGMAFEAKVSAEKPAGAPKVTDGADTPINRRPK